MGILNWLGLERRSFSSRDDELARLLGAGVTWQNGALVSPRTSENLSTILACVSAISSAISSLPVYVYKRTSAGREVDEGHPLQRIFTRGANDHQSWPDYIETVLSSVLLNGNSLSEVVVDGRGAVTALEPIPWSMVSTQLLPSGRMVFDISEPGLLGQARRGVRRITQDQALLICDRSDDGYLGVSRLRRAASVISGALSEQEFSHGVLSNGLYPSGTITADGKLDALQRQQLSAGFRSFAGTDKAAKALILDQGLKWVSLSISPIDQQLLESRRLTVEELCRIFGVPGPIVNDNTRSTFTNSETLIRFFAQSTLSSWCKKIEKALERQVLSEASRVDHEVEIDLSGLLRGSPTERWANNEIAVKNGILTVDEVRDQEGFGPLPAEVSKISDTSPVAAPVMQAPNPVTQPMQMKVIA